jgi:hypothetical protein
MKLLKIVETSVSPDCSVWGIRWPVKFNDDVAKGARVTGPIDAIGPISVFPK